MNRKPQTDCKGINCRESTCWTCSGYESEGNPPFNPDLLNVRNLLRIGLEPGRVPLETAWRNFQPEGQR